MVGTVPAGWNSNVFSAHLGIHIGFGIDIAHVLRLGSVGSGLTACVYLRHQGAHVSPGANVHFQRVCSDELGNHVGFG